MIPTVDYIIEKYVLKSSRKSKALSLSATIVLTVLYLRYRKVTCPPKSLRHLPQANNLRLMWAFLARWPINDIATKITIPAALQSNQGIYTRFDQNGWIVRIQNPIAAKMFLLKTDLFQKSGGNDKRFAGTLLGKFFLGRNILMLNGDDWKAHRKIANPATMDTMDSTVDFLDLMTRFTLDAIGLAGFDFDFNSIQDPKNKWISKYASVNANLFDPFFFLFPFLEKKFYTIIAHKRKVLSDEKAANLEKKESEKDLLTLMIDNEYKGEGALTDEELKSNLCVFFIAGHDTTANALTHAVYYLAVNPDIQDKARQEALRVLGDGPDDIFPTIEQTKSLTYINCIVKETLRIHNPIQAVVARIATEDTDLDGVFIPKGTKVNLDIHDIHHNPRIWNDPEVFNPDRFLPGGEADQLAGSGMAWLPFSNGARQCIGMNFSLAEQRVLLPLLLRRYEWSLPENSIHKNGLITTGMGVVTTKKMEITFRKRH